MKKLIICLLTAVMAFSVTDLSAQTRKTTGTRKTTTTKKKTTPAATKVDLKDSRYIGMGSLPGQPIDSWIEINFGEGGEGSLVFAGAYTFDSKYTATSSAGTMNVSMPINASSNVTLKSKDKGASMEGNFVINGKAMKLWLVKVPAKLSQDELAGEALENIFSSTDGYTALVKIKQGDGLLCVPADFSTDPAAKTWKMSFDNNAIQNIFGTSQGTYSVSEKDIKLVDSNGEQRTGISYDNGNYIEIPMGSARNMTLTLILIR